MKKIMTQLSLVGLMFLGCDLLLTSASFAEVHLSDLPASEREDERLRYQKLISHSPASMNTLENWEGFNELLPYVLASPDQEDAGSCLYMAISGIAEWWLAKLHPTVSRAADGPLDLSERFIMNFAGMEESDAPLSNWRTDSIYLFNQNHNQSLLNSAYRYTKGWFVGDSYSDHLSPATEKTPGAKYGTLFNWIDQRPENSRGVVQLPVFERDVIFADPEANQWNVGVAPRDIVEQVKETLRTRKAPVLVIYNQNSYWHAVSIVGYDDKIDNGNCSYTEHYRVRISDQIEALTRLAAQATDPAVKKAYELRAQRAREAKDKIERVYAAGGGCSSSQGAFFIRDSIYPDTRGPVYDYDQSRKGDEAPYAKKIVFKEYDWLRYFANHISVIYTK